MRYLITSIKPPFLTEWYDYDNHYSAIIEMKIYDLHENKYSIDGKTWNKIEVDHL